RDALLKCYQRFIELSFDRSLIAVKSIQTRRADVPPQVRGVFNLDELRIQEDQLHTEYDSLITRLRLMGVRDVIDAAETLHVRDTSWWTSAGLQTSSSKSLKRSGSKTVEPKRPCSGLQGQPWDLNLWLSSQTNTGLRQSKSSNLYTVDLDQIVFNFALAMEAV